jgi:hypothetical protein
MIYCSGLSFATVEAGETWGGKRNELALSVLQE